MTMRSQTISVILKAILAGIVFTESCWCLVAGTSIIFAIFALFFDFIFIGHLYKSVKEQIIDFATMCAVDYAKACVNRLGGRHGKEKGYSED